jgi:signal recognition particle GTPase
LPPLLPRPRPARHQSRRSLSLVGGGAGRPGATARRHSAEEITWLNKLRQGLNKTRLSLVNQLKAIVGQGPLNDDAVMEIEALLLQADVGVAATDKVIEALQARMRQEVLPPDQAIAYLKSILRDMLDAPWSTPTTSPLRQKRAA